MYQRRKAEEQARKAEELAAMRREREEQEAKRDVPLTEEDLEEERSDKLILEVMPFLAVLDRGTRKIVARTVSIIATVSILLLTDKTGC